MAKTEHKVKEATSGAPAGGGARFQQRRDAIVDTATPILNAEGFKGMRLAHVAEQIGLKSTGITYYFPRKEDLAVACIERGLEIFSGLLELAERETTPEARVQRLVMEFVERDTLVREGREPALLSFAVIRALEGRHREHTSALYTKMFFRTRRLLSADRDAETDRHRNSIRTLILLEQLYWSTEWSSHYDAEEIPRLAERMSDIILNGLGVGERGGRFLDMAIACEHAPDGHDEFMRAATREINLRGYRGASVDRISASLSLTKGAFYHHHDAKDELVGACFRRTFDIIRSAQQLARASEADPWRQLAAAVATLVRFQLGEDGPLLRTAALSSLPRDLQQEVLDQSYRAGRTFASMISDAMGQGQARIVDASIAAYLLAAGVNAAADVARWGGAPAEEALEDYVHALLYGLRTDRG